MLTEQDILNAFRGVEKCYFNTAYLYDFADYLEVTEDDLLENLIAILDSDPYFCYIFAKDKDTLYITNQLKLNYRSLNNINTLYIYNPIEEKFQIFFKDGYVDYPDWVDFISMKAFKGRSSLTSITIPNSVTSIGDEAFRECSSLTSITIPNSVTSIDDAAFYECKRLTNITIPDSVTSIGYSAFFHCTSLTSITIPNGITSIGQIAFKWCTNLTSVTIPNSVTSIGKEAFKYCNGNLTVYTKNPYVIDYCRENDIKYEEI